MNDAQPHEPEHDRPSRPDESSSLQWFREIVTAVISLTILGITGWMMISTFGAGQYKGPAAGVTEEARKAEMDQRDKSFGYQKDILLYGLSLLGTVTGYFLGRVPAELHAAQAQKAAKRSQERADDAKDEENKARLDKSRVIDRTMHAVDHALSLVPAGTAAPRGVVAEGQGSTDIVAVRQSLEELRDWLRESQI